MKWLRSGLLVAVIGVSDMGIVVIPSLAETIASPTLEATQLKSQSTEGTLPPITTSSGQAELALAQHLKRIGAKMYGAYWCPHCHNQMQLFGREAARQLPYIECAEDGANTQYDRCRAIKIKGFPTWKIKGKTYEGTQSLEQLAKVSGYRGSRKFKNLLPPEWR